MLMAPVSLFTFLACQNGLTWSPEKAAATADAIEREIDALLVLYPDDDEMVKIANDAKAIADALRGVGTAEDAYDVAFALDGRGDLVVEEVAEALAHAIRAHFDRGDAEAELLTDLGVGNAIGVAPEVGLDQLEELKLAGFVGFGPHHAKDPLQQRRRPTPVEEIFRVFHGGRRKVLIAGLGDCGIE